MVTETDLGTLEDERQITRVLMLYCELLDTGQADRVATEVYASEAVADYNFYVLNGRQAINDYLVVNMAGFRETAHVLSNVSLKVCDGNHTEVRSMLTAWHWIKRPEVSDSQTPTDFAQIVVCTDRLMCTPEGWRIIEHRARPLGPSIALTSSSVVLKRDENG